MHCHTLPQFSFKILTVTLWGALQDTHVTQIVYIYVCLCVDMCLCIFLCVHVCEECMSDCGARTQSKEGHFVNNALGNRDRGSRKKGTGAFYLRDTLFHGLFLGVISCLL